MCCPLKNFCMREQRKRLSCDNQCSQTHQSLKIKMSKQETEVVCIEKFLSDKTVLEVLFILPVFLNKKMCRAIEPRRKEQEPRVVCTHKYRHDETV